MTSVIQIKRGTASSWTSANTVLAAGEVGFETDTKKMKVGDGSTAWTSLSYTVTDGDITGVTAGTGISGGGSSGAVTLSIDTNITVDKTTAQTLTNKTLTSPVLTTPSISTMTTTGDILYASSTSTPARLGIGSTGNVLTVASGVPSWATPAGGGKVLQVVQSTTATTVSIASTSYSDTGLTGTITPTLATSKILVMATQGFGVFNSPDSGSFFMGYKLNRNINGGSFSVIYTPTPTNNQLWTSGTVAQLRAVNNLVYLDSPATTSAVIYKTTAQTNSTANNQSVNFQMENVATSVLIMMEIGV